MPLRKTISRLTRENNQLHGRIIKHAEEHSTQELSFKRELGALRGQLEDMRGLLNEKEVQSAEKG